MKDQLILVSAFIVLSGIIALEAGVPTAIAELLAGIIAKQVVTFDESQGMISFLADIGILTLMYVAGLEIDLDKLRDNLKPSMVIGITSFLFPFATVLLLINNFLQFTPEQAKLTAIALSTTSLAIVYPALCSSGLKKSKRNIILSAAMITDLFSMVALGMLYLKWSYLLIALILSLFLFTFLFPRFGESIFEYYKEKLGEGSRGNVAEFEFKVILLLLLVVAIVCEKAEVESALIAFLLGMVTSEVVVAHENLESKLRGITFGFFAPIFFFKVGLSIHYMDLLRNIGLMIAFFAVCFSSKYLGTYITSRRYVPGLERYVASLFNSRLSLGIIAAELGLRNGTFTPEIYSAVIGAVVLSTLISSMMYRNRNVECAI